MVGIGECHPFHTRKSGVAGQYNTIGGARNQQETDETPEISRELEIKVSSQPQQRNPHYWRNLALAGLLALVGGGCVLTVALAVILINNMDRLLEPPRTPITQTPIDYGITTYSDVTFTSSDGITLRGWYIPSQNGAAVILAHGYVDNRQFLLPEAAFLTRTGYGVLLFDFRGHGQSGSAPVTLGDHERRDLHAAVDFVAAQPDVNPDRIGGLGFSMGAATLAEVAAEDDRLRAVVIESPYATLDEVVRQRLNVPDVLRDPLVRALEWRVHANVNDVRPIDDLCQISPRPVFLIYGDQDDVLPPGTAQQMFAAACPPVETWLIHGIGHVYYRDHHTPGYEARVLAFFDNGLLDGAP
jgi:pimeloyl-ACP methyl ester carboxylesterase